MRIVHRHLLSYAMLALALSLPATALAQSTVNGVNTVTGNNLLIGAGGNVAMTVVPAGYVGIGALVPLEILDVDGGLTVVRASGAVPASFPAAGLYTGFYGNGLYGYIQSSTGVASDNLALEPLGGYVGIGTTVPVNRLTVIGDGTGVAQLGTAGCGTNFVGLTLGQAATASGCANYNLLSSPTVPDLYINRPTGNAIHFREDNNASDQMVINAGGAVTFSSTVTAVAYYHSSDARLKTDIHPIDHALDKILALKGVEFNWKKDGRADMGVTAQNVSEVFPNVVTKDQNGMMAVEYDSMIGPMIEAIRELKADNDRLAARVDFLEKSGPTEK